MIKYIFILFTLIHLNGFAMDLSCNEELDFILKHRSKKQDISTESVLRTLDPKTMHFLASAIFLEKCPIPVKTAIELKQKKVHPEHNPEVKMIIEEKIIYDCKTKKIVRYNW